MKTLITVAAALALAGPALAQREATLIVSHSEIWGDYLATQPSRSEKGRPVYMFSTDIPATEDQEARMSCTSDECLLDWTPVTVQMDLADGLDPGLVDILDPDGRRVVLYNGWPLYHYELDQVPTTDEPQGQGDVSYGGAWYLMSPSGEPIRP